MLPSPWRKAWSSPTYTMYALSISMLIASLPDTDNMHNLRTPILEVFLCIARMQALS